MISCIMVSLTGLHTKLWSVLYDYRQHSFIPANIIYAQESITNNLNFRDISFMCEICGSQYQHQDFAVLGYSAMSFVTY